MLKIWVVGFSFLLFGGFFVYLDLKKQSKPFKVLSILVGVLTLSPEYVLFMLGLFIILALFISSLGIGHLDIH